MGYDVYLSKRAAKKYRKMPEHIRTRVDCLMNELSGIPVPVESYDIRKLKGASNSYRVRIGTVRVAYSIVWQTGSIAINKIEFGGGVYR